MSDEQRPSRASGVDDLGFSPFRGGDGPTFPRNAERAAPSASTPDRTPKPSDKPASAGEGDEQSAQRAASASSAPVMERHDEKVTETTAVRPAVKAPVDATPRPPRKPATRRTRKARLRLTRVDPWSVMKVSFLFSIAFGIMMWVSTYVVWNVVESSGMFASINDTVNNVLGTGQSTFRLEDFVNQSRVLGFTALLAAVDIVLFTAIATLFSFLYNLAASVLGGLEVTLAED